MTKDTKLLACFWVHHNFSTLKGTADKQLQLTQQTKLETHGAKHGEARMGSFSYAQGE
jgi:hypothetical protein